MAVSPFPTLGSPAAPPRRVRDQGGAHLEAVKHDGPVAAGDVVDGRLEGRDADEGGHWGRGWVGSQGRVGGVWRARRTSGAEGCCCCCSGVRRGAAPASFWARLRRPADMFDGGGDGGGCRGGFLMRTTTGRSVSPPPAVDDDARPRPPGTEASAPQLAFSRTIRPGPPTPSELAHAGPVLSRLARRTHAARVGRPEASRGGGGGGRQASGRAQRDAYHSAS